MPNNTELITCSLLSRCVLLIHCIFVQFKTILGTGMTSDMSEADVDPSTIE